MIVGLVVEQNLLIQMAILQQGSSVDCTPRRVHVTVKRVFGIVQVSVEVLRFRIMLKLS